MADENWKDAHKLTFDNYSELHDVSASFSNELLCGFEEWLRSVCFQKPTPEAYDLAKCAWLEAAERNNVEHIEKELHKASEKFGW